MRKKFRFRRKNLVLQPINDTVAEKMVKFRQGDVLRELKNIPVSTKNGIGTVLAEKGSVIISQTCDCVQRDRLSVQVAPLIFLSEPYAAEALKGRRPRYANIPALGNNAFVDLETVGTLSKDYIVTFERQSGVTNSLEAGVLGRAIGRRFSRFPFPDELCPWFQGLLDIASSRARRPSTPEHEFYEQVSQLRLESENGFDGVGPFEITLIVIVKPGTLPMFPSDQIPEIDPNLQSRLWNANGDLKVTSSVIATYLKDASSPEDRYWLWMALGESWAKVCVPREHDSNASKNAVVGGRFFSEVIEADRYTMDRFLKSEMLDLDHISTPGIFDS